MEKGLSDPESAKNFLTLGIDLETISKGTGLSVETIEKIKDEVDKK